jgi:DNA-binding CsgD family transcriptional regulator
MKLGMLKSCFIEASQRLTARERQVLLLIGAGKTTKEIAAMLTCSAATIGNHRKSLCRKLGVHSTAELVHEGLVVSSTAL